jgi:hypothetical protein
MDENFRKQLNGYFIAFCRRAFAWSPAYRIATKRAERRTDEGIRWLCASCGALVGRGEKHRDHIDPVVPVEKGWDGSWDTYRDRMFVDDGAIQILCKECHRKKSNEENRIRRERKADRDN